MSRRVTAAAILCLLALPAAPAPRAQTDARASLLVSTAWLAARLHDADLVLLHVGRKTEYDAGHIAGARFITMDDVSAPMDHSKMGPTDLMLELPTPERLRASLESFGISDTSHVVLYYSGNAYSQTTRVFLTLDYAGLAERTVLLDGGLTAWTRDGHATTTDVAGPTAGQLAPLRTKPVTVDAAFMQANGRTPGVAIVDVRRPSAYVGTDPVSTEPGAPGGHIAGAVSLPLEQLWDDATSALRPAAELEALFTKAGVKPTDTVVAYCYIGQRATATLFAARTLGRKVLLYDGSMDEWSKRHLPVVK
jgi:thiosulfate/3-mercaptopyruvate sulfurtransferase